MDIEKLIKELNFKAVRSSGAGGQHVNKVSSKIELFFDLKNSLCFSDDEKSRLLKNLKTKLTKNTVLQISCSKTRSQHKNKEIAIDRFLELIKQALKIPTKRKATKPSKNSIKRNAEKKKRISVKKALRKKPKLD